jgi:hypothetical protein
MAMAKTAGYMSDAFNGNLALQSAVVGMDSYRGHRAATPMSGIADRRPRIGARKRKNTKLRMVSGRLYLDRSGRAFIRGVAEEVVDNNEEYKAGEIRRKKKGSRR